LNTFSQLLPWLCEVGEIDISGQRELGFQQEFPGAPKPPVYFQMLGNYSEEIFVQTAIWLLMRVRQMTADIMPSHIYGVPGGGEKFARFVAKQLGLPLISVDSLDVVGGPNEVLLVDNVSARAQTMIESAVAMRTLGYQVVRFVSFIDLPHCRKNDLLGHHGLTGSHVSSVAEVLSSLVEQDLITPEQQQAYIDYPGRLKDFFNWMDSIDL
jgi:orotate phosphoribosyltransferase